MRGVLIIATILMLLGAWIEGESRQSNLCRLSVRLVDSQTGETVPGVIAIRDADGKRVRPPELLSRGYGLADDLPINDWSVLARKTTITVPHRALTIRAFSGLQTELAETSLDLAGKDEAKLEIKIKPFYDAHARGYQSANTHLHLRKMSRQQADRYLVEVSESDRVDIVFVSHLERIKDDLEYTTNKYDKAQLHALSTDRVAFDHGEEHRHNFAGYGEGYGHVMLLNIPRLIHPVSIGPGISGRGTDGIPLRSGIEEARRGGGKVIWCHNKYGMEDIPNWFAGRLHANNIFDGGTHGSYKHSFYRYLNAGLLVPFSTGTDWFMYDFSRVYVLTQKKLAPKSWLEQLSSGRSFITNGPLLVLTVNGRQLGDTVDLAKPGSVEVLGMARGRLDFQQIELVHNGHVVHTAKTSPEAGHFTAELKLDLPIAGPSWLALRTPPPKSDRDPEFSMPTPRNEYGRELFSHTSAVFVDIGGERIFQVAAAQDLLDEVLRDRALIDKNGTFANNEERALVLSVYDEAVENIKQRIDRAMSSESRPLE